MERANVTGHFNTERNRLCLSSIKRVLLDENITEEEQLCHLICLFIAASTYNALWLCNNNKNSISSLGGEHYVRHDIFVQGTARFTAHCN
ncbi:hypothetical protein ACWJJH_19415 [Endozoicomonadaceae bacterium StTr2]